MGGSSQQPVTQQTTQTKDPWGPAQPYLQGIMGSAAGVFAGSGPYSNIANYTGGYTPYPGNTTAPLANQYNYPGMGYVSDLANAEPYGSTGLQGARGYLGNLVSNQGLNAGLQTAAGQYGDIYNRALGNENPYLQDIINRQVGQANAAASKMGRYGSGAHDAAIAQAIAPTLAQDYQQRQQLQMQATGAMGDIYGQGLQRAGAAAMATPTLDQARFTNAGMLMGLGDIQRQYDQALLDQQLKLYNANQAYPWEQLARYNAIIGGAGGLGGTQITTTPGATQPSTLQKILGGATAGAGIGTAFSPGIGTGIGAIGGGLLGLL